MGHAASPPSLTTCGPETHPWPMRWEQKLPGGFQESVLREPPQRAQPL